MSRTGLQRYQIMESLGSGSQGHTYRAIDRETDAEVAIKVLSLGGSTEWKSFELFEREAQVLAGLDHPGIPRYHDTFGSEDSGDYFLVMDLVRGRSLAEDVGVPGRFDEAGLRRLMQGLLEILSYLHARTPPVIHRDIKPGNIIMDPEGGVHLVDFGGVRLATRLEGGSTMIGTFGYMAPEQLHGDAGPGVDLYALGATICALASGQAADALPHEGLAIDLDQLRLPPKLVPVLRALLEPDPRHRVQTVAQAQALLDGRGGRPAGSTRGVSSKGRELESAGAGAEPSKALVVPEFVQELAETPNPMSVFVWISALMAAGGLAVVEFVALPLVYLILVAFAANKNKRPHGPHARGPEPNKDVNEDEAGITSLRDLRRSTSRNRELVAHVIRGTSPLREDRRALPRRRDD